jgi:hypothetical protein
MNAGFSADTRTMEFNRLDADIQGPSGLLHGTPVAPEDQHCTSRGVSSAQGIMVLLCITWPPKSGIFAPTLRCSASFWARVYSVVAALAIARRFRAC